MVLFYIMNDVVQRAKKKHVDVFCSTFEQPAISAVSLARLEYNYIIERSYLYVENAKDSDNS